jgi:cytoplasmic iron level regulating protein YaaA (DUF328/UPF0246 family)
MIILIHTSKTMRPPTENAASVQLPVLIDQAVSLASYLMTLPVEQIERIMKISPKLAETTYELIAGWTNDPKHQRAAIDSFLGDIYSGLQVADWDKEDREYANKNLRILSGLYGVLKPLDGVYPYRLEMGYRFPDQPYANLYEYWGDAVAKTLTGEKLIINLAALEYSKVVTDHLKCVKVVAPSFQTISPKTGDPTFVVVHAKIARGAFAHWLIKNRIKDPSRMKEFNELGYEHKAKLSTPEQPVFVCKEFGGIGLSVRLS